MSAPRVSLLAALAVAASSQPGAPAPAPSGTPAPVAAAASGSALTDAAASAAEAADSPGGGWVLDWSDEFEGPGIDASKWRFDLGGHGWGNGEAQYYSDRPENARIEDGCLLIEARRERYEGAYYSSARLKTQGLAAFRYGRIEARISLPSGKGTWPAFWMLGADFPEKGWPACGEIDIMEHVGREPGLALGTIHGPGYSGDRGPSTRVAAEGLEGAFHVYAVEWGPERIDWFLDGAPYASRSPADVAPEPWVFDHPFFIILNLAIGGGLGGPVAIDCPFPARMLVDYVRVYRRAD